MSDAEVRIDFHKLLGFRHIADLAGENELGSKRDQLGETTSAMARAAGAIFNKGGELVTCESSS